MATNLTGILNTPPATDPNAAVIQPPATGAPPATTPAATSWTDSLPEAYRNDAHIKGNASLEALLADYGNLKLNSGQQFPDPKTPFDQNKDFWGKLGVPEAADKYDLGLPEGSEINGEFLTAIQKVAHEHKISNEALKALAAVDLQFGNALKEQTEKAEQQQLEQRDQVLGQLWGDNAEARTEFVRKAFGQFSTNEEATQLNGTDVLSHPYFLHVMSKIGEAMQPPVSPGARSSAGVGVQQQVISSPEQAREAIKAFNADLDKAKILQDSRHPQHKQLNAELDVLYQKAFS